jgi:hypothetical protein
MCSKGLSDVFGIVSSQLGNYAQEALEARIAVPSLSPIFLLFREGCDTSVSSNPVEIVSDSPVLCLPAAGNKSIMF